MARWIFASLSNQNWYLSFLKTYIYRLTCVSRLLFSAVTLSHVSFHTCLIFVRSCARDKCHVLCGMTITSTVGTVPDWVLITLHLPVLCVLRPPDRSWIVHSTHIFLVWSAQRRVICTASPLPLWCPCSLFLDSYLLVL
jgi:hypothetical protein